MLRWLKESITLSNIEDDEKDSDDDNSDDGDTKDESPAKLRRRVLEAYKPKSAPIALQIMATALEKIPQLIVDMSKSKGNIPPKMGDQLEVLRKTLHFMTDHFGATTAVNQAMHTVEARMEARGDAPFSDAVKNQFVTKLVGPTKKAATAAVKSFDKHIAPMVRNVYFFSLLAVALECGTIDTRLLRPTHAPIAHTLPTQLRGFMKYRQLYDVRNGPPVHPPQFQYDNAYFGCFPKDYGPSLISQWDMYREEWHAKNVEGDGKRWESIGDEHIEFSSSYAYWDSKKDTWDVLSRVARWWCATPLGAILAERTFALGRVINTASRQSMSWDTFTQELSLKLQQEAVDRMLLDELRAQKRR